MKQLSAGKRLTFGRRLSLLVVLAIVLLLSALTGCGASRSSEQPTASPSGYEGTRLDRLAEDFRLTDHRGQSVALSDFQGKVVVLAFLDPECTDVCPLTANAFRLTAENLGEDAASVVFLAVNVNPELNSVTDVADATEKWGVSKLQNWHFLTGARHELQPVWEAYNILAEGPPKTGKPNELEHTPGVYIIDQQGSSRWYVSTAFDPGISLEGLLTDHILQLLPGAR